eukprot:2249987-Prymnesium_polylepis.1
MKQLLMVNPKKRIGMQDNSCTARKHTFFDSINFEVRASLISHPNMACACPLRVASRVGRPLCERICKKNALQRRTQHTRMQMGERTHTL